MTNILISPLGRSPGAVSGVLFALNKVSHAYDISRVVTVGTTHRDVLASVNILEQVLADANVAYEAVSVPAEDLREADGSADAFVATMGLALEEANRPGNKVHVAVTAGRSGMGALAALATNLYGADFLWHFWVKDDIAQGGEIGNLKPPFDGKNRYLNPTLVDGDCELVPLPFLDMRPLHPVIREYQQTGRAPDVDSDIYQLFAGGQIKRFRKVYPPGMTMAHADRILEIKAVYETLPPDEQLDRLFEVLEIMRLAQVTDANTKQRLVKMATAGISADQIVSMVQNDRDRMRFWQWVQENKDAIQTASGVGAFLLKALELWLKFRGII